jgi:hypothetical protein
LGDGDGDGTARGGKSNGGLVKAAPAEAPGAGEHAASPINAKAAAQAPTL